jgi:quercetin dioxygenase-like cupin family protein
MQVIKMNTVAKKSFESPLFTGPEVSRQTLLPDSKEFDVDIVNFGKGVRNKFHAHTSEQVLLVTSGRGYIATETEKVAITVGDVVLIPAGEKHWHGAVEDSEFSHIFVSQLGSALTQLEE